MSWVAQHTGYNPPHSFEDVMLKGPFKSWHHTHNFEVTKEGKVLYSHWVNYKLPMGFLGNLVAGRMIKKRLNRMFTAREIRLERDLKRHAEFSHVERKRFLWLDLRS